MKSETSLARAMRSAIKQAADNAELLEYLLSKIADGTLTPEKGMPRVRKVIGDVTQRIHEFNAYLNAFTTD